MTSTKLSSKGQLVIPLEVRDRHGWEAGTRLEIEDRGDSVVLREVDSKVTTRLDDVVGCTGYSGPRRSLRDMRAAIAHGARQNGD